MTYGSMLVTSTLVGPPPTPSGQLCPCNPAGVPLGGAGLPGADITGHVSDDLGHPIAGVCITLTDGVMAPTTVSTDSSGMWHYQFPGLGAHGIVWFTYTECRPTVPGWDLPDTFFTDYTFDSGLTITIDAKVEPGVAIEGVLVNGSGQPMPDAQVALDFSGGDQYVRRTTTDATGHFAFTDVGAGHVGVGYNPPGDNGSSFPDGYPPNTVEVPVPLFSHGQMDMITTSGMSYPIRLVAH